MLSRSGDKSSNKFKIIKLYLFNLMFLPIDPTKTYFFKILFYLCRVYKKFKIIWLLKLQFTVFMTINMYKFQKNWKDFYLHWPFWSRTMFKPTLWTHDKTTLCQKIFGKLYWNFIPLNYQKKCNFYHYVTRIEILWFHWSCDFTDHFLNLWRSDKIRHIGRIFDIYRLIGPRS